MEAVDWIEEPAWHTPVLVTAFAGWNDAGDAATMAVRHLIDATNAQMVATIDPEEFVEFQSTRPSVRLIDETTRTIDWPVTEIWSAAAPFGDLMLIVGTEPQLKWRTFCKQITDIAINAGANLALSLGALLADVPHSRAVNIIGTATDQGLIDRFGLRRSDYEGPTGIVGVLNDALGAVGIPAVSLWAAVPSYAAQAPSPKAALALLHRLASLTGGMAPLGNLEKEAANYERSIAALVNQDDDLAGYVRRLENAVDSTDPVPEPAVAPPLPTDDASAEALVEELEQFLREQDGS
jgi:predicted ATP-grasp superfamily ATP-dependent carboligase